MDDNQETIDLVKFIFTNNEQVRLDFASTSKEAIELFNANHYHACILDVSLPDLTGYYLGQLIRTSCPEMPLAFLTNYDGELTKENAALIQARFWAKGDVFGNPITLKNLIVGMASEEACGGERQPIKMPDIIEEIS